MITRMGLAALALLLLFSACGRRTVRLDFVPVEERLKPQTIEQDEGIFIFDKVAVLNLSGLLTSVRASSPLSQGYNKVSDLREALRTIERDPTVKAVILRLNSPGGTITASQIMYRDILAFKERSHKPVVTCMLDVCASGGYYVSCASDYRIAYPTTITGSIGVIIQTLNFTGTLDKLGISARAITSGPNKDVGSPLRPMTKNDVEHLQRLVDEFYAQFVEVVKKSPQHVKPDDWKTLTDGRVLTGGDALRYGLIDEVGDMDRAIAKAKELAGIQRAKIITYTRHEEFKGSVYAEEQPLTPQVNVLNLNLDLGEIIPNTHPTFLYLWTGQ